MSVNSFVRIGSRIKKLRKEMSISQREVAKRLNIPYSTYSNYENGNREPSEDMLIRIADVIGVSINDFFVEPIIIEFDTTPHPLHEKVMSGEATPEEFKEWKKLLIAGADSAIKATNRFYDKLISLHAEQDDLILHYYHKLNHNGRKEAIERMYELTLLPKYTEGE